MLEECLGGQQRLIGIMNCRSPDEEVQILGVRDWALRGDDEFSREVFLESMYLDHVAISNAFTPLRQIIHEKASPSPCFLRESVPWDGESHFEPQRLLCVKPSRE